MGSLDAKLNDSMMEDFTSPKNKKRKTPSEGESRAAGGSKPVSYYCDYCRKDLSTSSRMKCISCTDFDLCADCFIVGVEIGQHKKDHPYQIMDQLNFPVFQEDWGVDEELLLLEAIEMYGMGNWADCADHVSTKSKDECERHYFATYIDVPTFPLPDMSKNFDITLTRERKPGEDRVQKTHERLPKDIKFSIGPSQPITSQELGGWMPLRLEFDTEWFNDAEQAIATMAFQEDDTEAIRELKTRLLQVYTAKLQERYVKRQFILDNNLLDLRKQQLAEKKKPKADREVVNEHNVFLQVLTRKEFDDFIGGLVEENSLRRRIEELKAYRANGCRTFQESDIYELEKRRKQDPKFARESAMGPTSRAARWLSREQEMARSGGPKKRGSAPLDISGLPGVELLAKAERQLCTDIRLYPQQYLIIKETLIKEAVKNGGMLRKAQARALIKIDVNKTGRIVDFMQDQGWLNRGVPPEQLDAPFTTTTTPTPTSTPAAAAT
jgi:transcriptional adapter 2-alpha